MAQELSSNWKRLQATIKAESSKPAVKRKSVEAEKSSTGDAPRKRQRLQPRQSERKHTPSSNKEAEPQPKQTKPKMGGVQSSKISDEPKNTATVSPALALFAEDNDISLEDIAQAYGLGVKSNSLLSAASACRPNEGLAEDVEVGKYLAIDCEMVGVGPDGYESALARVSVVDFHGRQVYDSFVRPKERVVDWRTHVSGVSAKDMRTARELEEVQSQVAELLKGRILVGHDVRHDLQALLLDHSLKSVRDTARFSGFKRYGHGPKPALKVLAQEILGVEIQKGQHSSIEDARVAMLLFRKFKSAFDAEHASRYPETTVQPQRSKGKSHKAKKKKKY